MRLGVIPESEAEANALEAGDFPIPVFQTVSSLVFARAIIGATTLGLFDTLYNRSLSVQDIANAIDTDEAATGHLVSVLSGGGYLFRVADRYELTPLSSKWLVSSSPQGLTSAISAMVYEYRWIDRIEEYLRSGEPMRFHEGLGSESWEAYQKAMYAFARLSANETAARIPVPDDPKLMLDIGGSHGYYSVAMCRRYPDLKAVILDLPGAIEHAAPLLAKAQTGDRIIHRPGDARLDRLGDSEFDIVFNSNLLHHFNDAINRDLARRAAEALRPGGFYVVCDTVREDSEGQEDQISALAVLAYAMMSEGLWSKDDIVDWQRAAGLVPQPTVFLSQDVLISTVLQAARKADPDDDRGETELG